MSKIFQGRKYRRNKHLKELIAPSSFHRTKKESNGLIEKCNRRYNICKHSFVLSTEFTCHATKRKCKIRGIIYIACRCCGKQYIDSAPCFKERIHIHKYDISASKIRGGVGSHLLNVCTSATCKPKYLQVQLI